MSSGNNLRKLLFVRESLDLAFISKGQLMDMIFLVDSLGLELDGHWGPAWPWGQA